MPWASKSNRLLGLFHLRCALLMANCNQASSQQKWNSFFRGGYNVIEKQGTKLNLNHRERNGEIRLHRTAKSTSQFLALPKLSNMDKASFILDGSTKALSR